MLRTLLAVVGITLIAVSFACNYKDKNADLQPDVRAAIDRYNQQLQEAYLHADVNGILAFMTDSVVISPIGSTDLIGQESLRNVLAPFFQDNSVTKYELHVSELEVYSDVAYDRGSFVWQSFSRGGSKLNSTGRYSIVRHKGQDGMWRIHRLIENQLPETK